MARFVLVAGAWHGGWCWERVVPLLQAAGHSVDAPDLLGMGADPTPPGEATIAAWARQVARFVLAAPEPVILVGHSRGGIVISAVVELVPDHVSLLVYLAAFLLPDGATLGAAAATALAGPPVTAMGRAGVVVLPEMIGERFYNTTEPHWVARAGARLGEEPLTSFTTPVHVTAEAFGRVPRAYIECVEDRAVPLSLKRSMQAALPCATVVTMATDHSPFYSAPEALANHLIALAQAA